MMSKRLIGQLLSLEAQEPAADAARQTADQLRTPKLDERANLYLRAVHGKRDFGSKAHSDARNRLLNAMATNIAVKLGNNQRGTSERPADYDETQQLQVLLRRLSVFEGTAAKARPEYEVDCFAYEPEMARPQAVPPEAEITPSRRLAFKFPLRTISMLCVVALIAGAGTLLFFRNVDSPLAWFAQPQQEAKTEVAVQYSGSKGAFLLPATVKPPAGTSEPFNQQPSPEELAELAKRGRALLTTETASRAPATEVQVQAVASRSPTQLLSPEELAELVKRGSGLLGTGSKSLLSSLAASATVASGSPTFAAALAWYQNSKVLRSTESIRSVGGNTNPSIPQR